MISPLPQWRRLQYLICFVCLLSGPGLRAEEQEGWQLVWADEFDYEGLPDPTKWSYEHGLVRNRESQYYTRERRENARVEGGRLILEARKEDIVNERHQPDSDVWMFQPKVARYTSASLVTLHKASWKYGRIEIRAKLPQGLGVWPAFWMMGINEPTIGWPHCGEIDIMEYVGHEPVHIHGTVHYAQEGKHASKGQKTEMYRPFEDYHVFAIEWDAEQIRIFADQTNYHTIRLDDIGSPGEANAFRQPFFLLLNLALGGNWGHYIDDRNLPQQCEVDYVRVYQKKTATPAP